MNAQLRQASPLGEIVWSCVEDGFYVASCDNKFLGFVDRISTEVFQVCDANSQQLGLLSTLEDAQSCLTAGLHRADPSATKGTAE